MLVLHNSKTNQTIFPRPKCHCLSLCLCPRRWNLRSVPLQSSALWLRAHVYPTHSLASTHTHTHTHTHTYTCAGTRQTQTHTETYKLGKTGTNRAIKWLSECVCLIMSQKTKALCNQVPFEKKNT